jgi:tetratricopeptide (TPR) repeat protein
MVNKLLEQEPNDLFLNYTLGLEHVAEHNLPEAEGLFKKVLGLDANYIAAYYQLGKLLESRKKNEEAILNYKKGLEKAKEQKNNKAASEFEEAIFLLED